MQKTVLTFTLLFTTLAAAADVARCGRDDFGNVVCLDKDGVMTSLPRDVAGDRKGDRAAGVSVAEPKSGHADTNDWLRCGIDPFGNKVCRQ